MACKNLKKDHKRNRIKENPVVRTILLENLPFSGKIIIFYDVLHHQKSMNRKQQK